jgi:hypothetical protein
MHLTPTDDIVALHECKLTAIWKWVSEKVLNTAGVVHRINIAVIQMAKLAADKNYRNNKYTNTS